MYIHKTLNQKPFEDYWFYILKNKIEYFFQITGPIKSIKIKYSTMIEVME